MNEEIPREAQQYFIFSILSENIKIKFQSDHEGLIEELANVVPVNFFHSIRVQPLTYIWKLVKSMIGPKPWRHSHLEFFQSGVATLIG